MSILIPHILVDPSLNGIRYKNLLFCEYYPLRRNLHFLQTGFKDITRHRRLQPNAKLVQKRLEEINKKNSLGLISNFFQKIMFLAGNKIIKIAILLPI